MSDAKTKKKIFKKKSWSHMTPNRLIRREMQKKIFFLWQQKSAVNGGGGSQFFMKDINTLGNY